MLPNLQKLAIEVKRGRGDQDDQKSQAQVDPRQRQRQTEIIDSIPEKKQTLDQLLSGYILYAIYDYDTNEFFGKGIYSNTLDDKGSSLSGNIRIDFDNIMSRMKTAEVVRAGTFNQGVAVFGRPGWLDDSLVDFISNGNFDLRSKLNSYIETRSFFYRMTKVNPNVAKDALAQEAYMMLTAASKGFGPSVYAIYITDNSIDAIMDNASQNMSQYLSSHASEIDVDHFVEELMRKCRLASQAGFLMLDIKPDNILCDKKQDGSLNIMFIDFDPRFTFEIIERDVGNSGSACIQYLNLLLLIVHIQCTHTRDSSNNRLPTINSLIKNLLSKLNMIEIEAGRSLLCSVLTDIRLVFKKNTSGGWDLENGTDIPTPVNGPTFRREALEFVHVVDHYFDKTYGKYKCHNRFVMTLDDETPLTQQLYDWVHNKQYPISI